MIVLEGNHSFFQSNTLIQMAKTTYYLNKNENCCDFCNAVDGAKSAPFGLYRIKLKVANVLGSHKLLCQLCLHKHKQIVKRRRREMSVYLDRSRYEQSTFITRIMSGLNSN